MLIGEIVGCYLACGSFPDADNHFCGRKPIATNVSRHGLPVRHADKRAERGNAHFFSGKEIGEPHMPHVTRSVTRLSTPWLQTCMSPDRILRPVTKETPYLKRLLDLLEVTQSDLARRLDTDRQQVSKWASEGRQIRYAWAKRIEIAIGIPWHYLVEAVIPPELQSGDDDAKKINQQLLLIREGWPLLSIDEREAILRTILSLIEPRRKAA